MRESKSLVTAKFIHVLIGANDVIGDNLTAFWHTIAYYVIWGGSGS